MSKKGLGRGIGALFGDTNTVNELVTEKTADEKVWELAVNDVVPNPYQPRRDFNEQELQNLADSIANQGMLQPIVVREVDGKYQIVAGERRWRAAQIAGLSTVAALVRVYSDVDSMKFTLLENLQRQDLNPMETAGAYRQLMQDGGMTQEELSKKLGVSRSGIANTLRLLNMPEDVQLLIAGGKLSEGTARAIAGLPNFAVMSRIAQQAVEECWSVRQAEKKVSAINKEIKEGKKSGKDGKKIPKEKKDDPGGMQQVKQIEDLDIKTLADELQTVTGTQMGLFKIPGTEVQVLGFKIVNKDDVLRIYEALKAALEPVSRKADNHDIQKFSV